MVVELGEQRRQAALEAGAIAAIDPQSPDAQDQIRTAAGGTIRGVIDFVGSEQTTLLGVELLAKGGMLVVVGLFGGAMAVPIPMVVSKAITIRGSYIGRLDELRDLVAQLRRTGLPPVPITRRPLEEANAAIAALRSGQVVGRTVLIT